MSTSIFGDRFTLDQDAPSQKTIKQWEMEFEISFIRLAAICLLGSIGIIILSAIGISIGTSNDKQSWLGVISAVSLVVSILFFIFSIVFLASYAEKSCDFEIIKEDTAVGVKKITETAITDKNDIDPRIIKYILSLKAAKRDVMTNGEGKAIIDAQKQYKSRENVRKYGEQITRNIESISEQVNRV